MIIIEPGLQFYVDKLNADQKFSFNRFGNGEWDCIMGLWPNTRSKSQDFTPDLCAKLTEVVTAKPEPYYMALQNTASLERSGLLHKVDAWLSERSLTFQWHLGDVFHRASGFGELAPFVRALSAKRVVVVGPPWLLSLPFASILLPVAEHNCWDQVDELTKQLLSIRNAVISFSAGPTTKVLIDRLFPYIGDSCWLIDAGSLWDPYCGVNSRTYHRKMSSETLAANLV